MRSLATDPRADPRLVAAAAMLGLDQLAGESPVTIDSPLDEILAVISATEELMGAGFTMMLAGAEAPAGVVRRTETIIGVDGNEILLFIHQPADHRPGETADLPAIVHTHGGGMTLLAAADLGYQLWRDDLATHGLVVVGVEFRNAGGKLGPHPFPAGLNDCTSAARWVAASRAALGVSKVVMSGESGGGNLSLATSLKANAEGWIDEIAGVYGQCPYISGQYAKPPVELTSLHENDGYFLACDNMGAMVRAYDPEHQHAENPLAWPLAATRDDLVGLPPHVISVNELDPLRDEGLTYARKLLAAGVSTVMRTVNGTCHAGDLLFRVAMPDVYAASLRDVAGFARSL